MLCVVHGCSMFLEYLITPGQPCTFHSLEIILTSCYHRNEYLTAVMILFNGGEGGGGGFIHVYKCTLCTTIHSTTYVCVCVCAVLITYSLKCWYSYIYGGEGSGCG